MKILYKEKIGEYTIVRFIADAAIDSAKTIAKIKALVTPEMTEADIECLYMENLVYAITGKEAELIDDGRAKQLLAKLNAMGENKKLLTNGEYIDDYRDIEYWIKSAEKWAKEKIEEIGVSFPSDAVLQENLTSDQQQEISAQQEEERFASLTPKQKAEEQKAKIQARFAEIDRLAGPRPVREALAQLAAASGLDTSFLMRHETEAQGLREQLAAMSA